MMKKSILLFLSIILCLCTSYACAEEDGRGVWSLNESIDEFDMKTGNFFIAFDQPLVGQYSNYAVENELLHARISCLKDEESGDEYFAIALYQKGERLVTNRNAIAEYYDITITDSFGNKDTLTGIYNGMGDQLFIEGSSAESLIMALRAGGAIHFYLERRDASQVNFSFSIDDASSFSAAYDNWRQASISETASADTAPAAEGIWQVVEYIDEFDLPTGAYYIASTESATGTYKNAFTDDGVLTAQLYVYRSEEEQEEEVAIHLFKDGKYLAENDEPLALYYDSVVMNGDGEKENFVGCFYARGSELRIGPSQAEPVIAALRGGGTVRFSLTRRDAKIIRYIFTFEDASGFDSVYTSWSQK